MDNRKSFVELLNSTLSEKYFSGYQLMTTETDCHGLLVEEYRYNNKVYRMTCELSDGKRNGKGIMKEGNLEKAVVTFEDDKISGNLIIIDKIADNHMVEYTSEGKKVYEGGYLHLYEEFRYDDKGTLYSEGVKYVEGEWENGKMLKGVIYGKDGNAIGWINENEMVIYEKTEKLRYGGNYELTNGVFQRHGKGRLFNDQIVIFKGTWEHGMIKEGDVHGQKKNIKRKIEGGMMKEYSEKRVIYEGGYEIAEGMVRRHGEGSLYQKVLSSVVGEVKITEDGIAVENKNGDYQEVEVTFRGKWKQGKIKEGVLYDHNTLIIGNYANTSFQKSSRLSRAYEIVRSSIKRSFQMTDHSQMEEKRRSLGEDESRLSGEDEVGVGEEVVVSAELGIILNNDTTEFRINDRYMNNCPIIAKLNLSMLKRLVIIDIGNQCFQNVREFVLDGLEQLKSVKIGDKCFSISDNERDDGVCRITNCRNLTQLEIGDYSFEDFEIFELSHVNSLQSIQFGKWNFKHAEECILRDHKNLKTISFSENSFQQCHYVEIINLPELSTISFNGASALAGDNSDARKRTIDTIIFYDNKLVMRDLPKLEKIEYNGDCKDIHCYMGTITLKNIQKLGQDNIQYGTGGFEYNKTVKEEDALVLSSYIESQKMNNHNA